MNKFLLSLITASLVCFLSQEAIADSFYCKNRSVAVGKHKREVERICGAPTFIDERLEEKTIQRYRRIKRDVKQDEATGERMLDNAPLKRKIGQAHSRDLADYRLVSERTVVIKIEEWTYNFKADLPLQDIDLQLLTPKQRSVFEKFVECIGKNKNLYKSQAGQRISLKKVIQKIKNDCRMKTVAAVWAHLDHIKKRFFFPTTESLIQHIQKKMILSQNEQSNNPKSSIIPPD